ncbi:putative UPF0496 protein 2 [Hordeum vulgare subsp. vulgare]|uniref:Predicted protein n=1 Tax=Hordeum vulgare subsp. vulgare TaxID=112509 RepID=F2DP52_HORVV|nr:putative UPF0496 protein 2 [Hordeum vulgare subsp. vulgare]BAJ96873.1 predicted protein [Hordeum vulgare subsp. vulgare]
MWPFSSSPSSLAKSMFSVSTPDAMMDGSSSSSSSVSPAAPPPRSPLDVDEEYGRAFKSRSFLDLWSHAHRSFRQTFKLSSRPSTSLEMLDDGAAALDKEPSCSYTILDDFELEPRPEALARAAGRRHRRRRRWGCRRRRHHVEALLLEYFDVTRDACEACSALLAAVGAARRHHLVLRRLLHRLDVEGDGDDDNTTTATRDALVLHVREDNPLSPAGGRLDGFDEAHARCAPLSKRLAAARRRLRRLAKMAHFARCAAATAVVGASATAVVAAVVFAAHAVIGVGAAAAVAFCATSTRPVACRTNAVKKLAGRLHGRRRRWHARAGEAAVDAAARGAYIVGRDLDTVSRMVRRAHDELEHGRDMARIAVSGHGERPLLQEVAREEEECGEDLRSQLEELEEHACLCLITINRSRRMVAQEMERPGSPSGTATSQD